MTRPAAVFDPRPCTLGEGPLWHPGRGQLFWFDITGNRLLTREAGAPRHWDFPGNVSAAGWIDETALLVASETGLLRLDLASGATELLAPLEAEDPRTRSNDGRADPWGGFWIGTMGKAAEPGLGAIWRYFRGEVRRLFAPVTIPNAIAFAPDGSFATFADTTSGRVMRTRLGRDGWPAGEAEVFLDLRAERLNPDGAVFDADGTFWLAEWGAARVSAYGPDGRRLGTLALPARHSSCPAFGGDGLATLFCTSARQGLTEAEIAAQPLNGQTFAAEGVARGQPEHQVLP
ncbi:MAG: SMP-30/gluconolactonase/LRE family protein [Rhodobacteraceae bacterium]|nr:SMP-30/gluconolactonase/LRE family protein [Paracoccaceae bacterium]